MDFRDEDGEYLQMIPWKAGWTKIQEEFQTIFQRFKINYVLWHILILGFFQNDAICSALPIPKRCAIKNPITDRLYLGLERGHPWVALYHHRRMEV